MVKYFYINAMGNYVGPFDIPALKAQGISRETHVWTEGMKQWVKAGDIPELAVLFVPMPPEHNMNNGQSYQTPPNMAESYASGVPGQGFAGVGYGPQQPTPPYQHPQPTKKPDNWLWLGICTTILCCLPLGIVSIVYSTKVNSAWEQGNYTGAMEYVNKAKTFGFISAGVGILFNLLMLIFAIAA